MRIVIITLFNNSFHAEWNDQFSFGLCRELNELGAHAVIAAYHNFPTPGITHVYDSKVFKLFSVMPDGIASSTGIRNFELRRLENFLREYKPDVILSLWGWPVIARLAKSVGAKLVFWMTYVVEPDAQGVDFVQRCDVTFTAFEGLVKAYEENGASGLKLLPLGYDPVHLYPLTSGKRFPVTYIGTFFNDRRVFGWRRCETMLYPLVNKLEKDVHIFGRGWKNDPNVRAATLHGVVDWRDIKQVYAQTEVVLGMTAERAIELDGINGRVFEALGCGSFFISDNAPAISRMFSAGKELVTFQDGEDIVGLVENYLDSKGLRDSIASAGHNRAKVRDIVANHAKAVLESASRL